MCQVESSDMDLTDWSVSSEALRSIYPLMYKMQESGGKVHFSQGSKTASKENHKVGTRDSARTEPGLCNWHTHPPSCYLAEKTVWGWISGEDARESILYGMRGNVSHFVPSVEGVYIVQVNPCLINSLKNLKTSNVPGRGVVTGDQMRGAVVSAVEAVLKTTHAFRTYSFCLNDPIFPEDFLTYINSLTLQNLITPVSKNSNSACGLSGCTGVPKLDRGARMSREGAEFFAKYKDDAKFSNRMYHMSKRGNLSKSKTNMFYADIPVLIKYITDNDLFVSDCPKTAFQQFWGGKELFNVTLALNRISGLGEGEDPFYGVKKTTLPSQPAITMKDRWDILWSCYDFMNERTQNQFVLTLRKFWECKCKNIEDLTTRANATLINWKSQALKTSTVWGGPIYLSQKVLIWRDGRIHAVNSPVKGITFKFLNVVNPRACENNKGEPDGAEELVYNSPSGSLKGYVVFGTSRCPHCTKLKERLKNLNIDYEDNTSFGDVRQAIEGAIRTYGHPKDHKSVPMLYLDGQFQGGSEALRF